jgi:hypothetical protein
MFSEIKLEEKESILAAGVLGSSRLSKFVSSMDQRVERLFLKERIRLDRLRQLIQDVDLEIPRYIHIYDRGLNVFHRVLGYSERISNILLSPINVSISVKIELHQTFHLPHSIQQI